MCVCHLSPHGSLLIRHFIFSLLSPSQSFRDLYKQTTSNSVTQVLIWRRVLQHFQVMTSHVSMDSFFQRINLEYSHVSTAPHKHTQWLPFQIMNAYFTLFFSYYEMVISGPGQQKFSSTDFIYAFQLRSVFCLFINNSFFPEALYLIVGTKKFTWAVHTSLVIYNVHSSIRKLFLFQKKQKFIVFLGTCFHVTCIC